MSGTKVYVGNVADSARKDELQELFEKHGVVTECDIIRDFAFVHFESPSDASAAIEALNGYDYLGRKLQVESSRARSRGGPRGRGGPPRGRDPPYRGRYRSPPRYSRDAGYDYDRRPPPPRDYYSARYSPPSYRGPPPSSRDYSSSYRSRSPYGRDPAPRYSSPPRYSEYDRYGPPRSGSGYGRSY